MDYTSFIKSKFLNQSVDSFTNSNERFDFKGLEKIVSQNTVFGMGKIATTILKRDVRSVFESLDGVPLTADNGMFVRKDGFIDKDEMYQTLKCSYKSVYGKEVSQDRLSKLTVKQAMSLLLKCYDKKNKVIKF